jgi:hypothetical protein
MAWYRPTPLELSAIEQIETAFGDDGLLDDERDDLLILEWGRLEQAHGSRVLSIVSPEGDVIERPFRAESK